MQNRTAGFGWLGLILRLALMGVFFVAVGAVAEDDKAPAAPPAAQKPDTTAKPAPNPVDESGDYEKNAAKRFTPSERTPADKNVSFPVDI